MSRYVLQAPMDRTEILEAVREKNAAYAVRVGAAFAVSAPPLHGRSAVWQRPYAIEAALEMARDADELVWLDPDVLVVANREDIFNALPGDADILAAQLSLGFHPGVLVIRRSRLTLQLFQHIRMGGPTRHSSLDVGRFRKELRRIQPAIAPLPLDWFGSPEYVSNRPLAIGFRRWSPDRALAMIGSLDPTAAWLKDYRDATGVTTQIASTASAPQAQPSGLPSGLLCLHRSHRTPSDLLPGGNHMLS